MEIITTNTLTEDQKQALRKLWNQEYPMFLNYQRSEDFDLYLVRLADARHHLLVNEHAAIIGWAFDFEREKERWFGILVDKAYQKQGWGSKLLNDLKQRNRALNGWMIDRSTDEKQNGELYQSPQKFYQAHQFTLLPHERMGFDKISAIKITWQRSH